MAVDLRLQYVVASRAFLALRLRLLVLMATSSAGRDRHVSRKSSRTHLHGSSRRRKARETDGEVKEVKKPDVEELRRIRAAYFGRPLTERKKAVASAAKPRSRHEEASSTRRTSSNDHEHRTKRSSRTSAQVQEAPRQPVDRTAEYVYGGLVPPITVPDVHRSVQDRPRKRSLKSSGSRHSSSSRRDSLPSILEQEVTPDDSISQVAERQMYGTPRSSTREHSSSKRHSTSSARLAPIDEKSGDHGSSVSSRRSRRDSTLLGSLFGRSPAAEPPRPRLVECLTCGSDDVPSTKTAKLSCGHRMCHECLKRVFTMSVTDPAHMPPKCCTSDHIPLKHVEKLFDLKFKVLWNRKFQEYHTKNRIYCPNAKCGDWIKPSHFHTSQGRKFALCARCKTKVCVLCNNKMHRSRECPEDPEIARLVETAKEKGWQRCFNCQSMVELKEGCNHMTCRCMAEFCMICGSKWKSCDCPWFNYGQLPDPDRLHEMRVPEPIQIIYRQVFGAATGNGQAGAPPLPSARAVNNRLSARRTGPAREITYQQELDERRRIERLDADLAHRMQLASLMEGDEPPNARARQVDDTWGLGNAAGHFMNDDFVQNAANVVMSAFGDASMGRRGDRASGRRRRPRQEDAGTSVAGRDAGLVPNFLGDQSVLGLGPGRARP